MASEAFTRISEWELKTNQGMLGMRNLSFTGNPLRVCIWKYVMM
jgi:hypothetical protein